MYKKTVTYEDYDGMERTETFYFNLTKAELTKFNASESGGLKAKLEQMIAVKDAKAIMETFESILEMAYGEKSLDGRKFMKSKEIFDEFKSTMAYDKIFMELVTDEKASMDFINGILPADISKAVSENGGNVTELRPK